MIVFLIIVAVLAALIIAVLSLSATFTITYDKGWKTKIKVLFIEKEISLTNILNKFLFPEQKPEEESENQEDVKEEETESKEETPKKPKPNPLKKLWEEEGIVGILSLVSNLLETANSAVIKIIRGLHIYSLYVMIIVGGGNAAQIGQAYGKICSRYYAAKGLILSNMKVDNFDEIIQPDFIAPCNEYEFQFIGSINVATLLGAVISAGIVFVKNLIKNKKENKKV